MRNSTWRRHWKSPESVHEYRVQLSGQLSNDTKDVARMFLYRPFAGLFDVGYLVLDAADTIDASALQLQEDVFRGADTSIVEELEYIKSELSAVRAWQIEITEALLQNQFETMGNMNNPDLNLGEFYQTIWIQTDQLMEAKHVEQEWVAALASKGGAISQQLASLPSAVLDQRALRDEESIFRGVYYTWMNHLADFVTAAGDYVQHPNQVRSKAKFGRAGKSFRDDMINLDIRLTGGRPDLPEIEATV
jgi:hypothetical protein